MAVRVPFPRGLAVPGQFLLLPPEHCDGTKLVQDRKAEAIKTHVGQTKPSPVATETELDERPISTQRRAVW